MTLEACLIPWGVWPELGNTLTTTGGRTWCRAIGCGRRWNYDRRRGATPAGRGRLRVAGAASLRVACAARPGRLPQRLTAWQPRRRVVVFEDAARARAREASLMRRHGHDVAAVYLAGYVVECRLKHLLQRQGRSLPRSGASGHDLRTLWEQAGLRPQDLSGHRAEFMRFWNTSLRYQVELPKDVDVDNLLQGGRELASMVSVRVRYTQPLRRGRRRPKDG